MSCTNIEHVHAVGSKIRTHSWHSGFKILLWPISDKIGLNQRCYVWKMKAYKLKWTNLDYQGWTNSTILEYMGYNGPKLEHLVRYYILAFFRLTPLAPYIVFTYGSQLSKMFPWCRSHTIRSTSVTISSSLCVKRLNWRCYIWNMKIHKVGPNLSRLQRLD